MAGKIDYAATSKLRRKVKTKLVLFKDKVKKELSHAINDLAAADSDDNFFRFKKVVANENSGSVSSLNTSDSQVTFLTDCEKRVLDIVSSSSDDDDDDGKDSKAKYKVLLEDEEDNFIERFNKFFQKSTKSNVEKSNKFKVWKSVVTVILIEAKDLSPPDPNIKALDPYCMLRLGNEICKSRVVWKSLNPRWLQQIDLHLFDDTVQLLEISIWDKDNMSEEHLGSLINFTVPYTSFIMMIMLAITTVILYTIHLRYCLMIIGIALFVKKIMKPHAIPNNEIMDLLSRVPDDEMVLDYKELKVIWANGTEWPPRPDFISQKP